MLITYMIIHIVTYLPYKGMNLAKEFGGKIWGKGPCKKNEVILWPHEEVTRVFNYVDNKPNNSISHPNLGREGDEKVSHGRSSSTCSFSGCIVRKGCII